MASYPAPSSRGSTIYNSIAYHTIGTAGENSQVAGITQAEADLRYLFLGNTQGTENFDYSTTFSKQADFIVGTQNTEPLVITNGTFNTQLTTDTSGNFLITATDAKINNEIIATTTDLALYETIANANATFETITNANNTFANKGSSNTFLSQASPAQPYQQIITGNNLSSNTNAPLVIKNQDTGEYFSFYIDPSTNYDATLYSNQSTGGLTVRNQGNNSFTINPTGNNATFQNPINALNNNITTGGVLTGGSLTLSSSGNTTSLTTTSTGLNIADPVTCNNLNLSNSGYSTALTTTSSGLNINDPVVAAGSVTCVSLNLSDTGYSTSLTTSATGLTINDPVTCNSLTTSGTGSITTSGVLQLNTGAYSVQLGCGNLGNQLLVNNNTRITGSLNASADVVASGIIQGNTLTTVSDATIGGTATITGTTIANSSLRLAANNNLSGATISTAGLTIGRNLEVGQNEFDIIAINPTTANYLNIYGSQSSISVTDTPIVSIANNTAYLKGNEIATVNEIPTVFATYFTGQIVMSISSSAPTATGGIFLLCNGTSYSSTTYPKLFAIIGTQYGTSTGGGLLPNLVSKFPYGANNGVAAPYANISGTTSGGALSYSLTQVPPHTHSNSVSNLTYYTGYSQSSNDSSGSYVVNRNASSTAVTNNAGTNISTGAIDIPTVPPYIVVSYFIFAN